MRKVNFLGDLHCDVIYKKLFKPNTVQLGDLCLLGYKAWGFPEWGNSYPPGKRLFISGNHDHFPSVNEDATELTEIVPNLFHIPRGYVDGKVLFIGGADCIPPDRKGRLPGRDWFPEEQISQQQFDRIMNIDKEIEVIASHTCPLFAAEEVLKNPYGVSSVWKLPSEIAMEAFFEKFKPKQWVFGHFHKSYRGEIKGCEFIALDIAESIELLVPTENIGEEI